MAEQQFTQEDLTALNQDSQSLDQMPMQGPVPKPKEAVKTAKIDEKKPLIPVGQQAVSIGEFKTPAQKSIEEEAVKEPTNLGSLAYSFDSVKGLDATYSDFPLQGRMKIEGYRAAYENKNNQIKRHQKLIDNIVAKTTDEFDIEDLTQTDQNGNKGLDKERLRRIVTNKVKAIGGNGIVADYVYSKAAIAAEYKFNLNKQKTAFDEKLKTANIPKPKDADIVEKEFKDVELKARMEMKSAKESLNMDFISEANIVNDKYAYSLNEVVANAPYKMNDAVNEAKTQLLNEKIDASGQNQYFETSIPDISDEEIKQRAASLFEQNNADYLTTEYLPVVAQMQNEIKGVSKKYNNILERKKSELQATYEKKFSQMKALYEKEANDYNSKIDKLWNETGVELKSEQEKKMMDTYKNMGMTDAFLSKFSGAAGNMLFGLGTHLRANGIEGSIIDFLTASGQDARFYNNTYTPSIKDAYLSPKFWAGGVGELLGSSSVIAATTIATQNPYIGALLSNIVEGSSMAGAAYDNQLMKGKDPLEAREAANNVVKMNMLTMPLNALQAKLFMPFTKGAGFTGAFKKLAAGSAGGTIEEVYQAPFEEGEGFKTEKLYSPDTLEMGLKVFGTQMLMGIPGGAVSGLVDNINKNKNIPSPMAQIGARMARENGPSRVSAIAEGLNAIGEIDEQQTAQMKMLSDAIVEIEKEATSIGLEGDKKDAYVGIAYDIKQLEQQKSQAGSESAKSVLDDQLSEKKQQLRKIINDKGEVVRVVVAGTSIVAPIEEVNKLADTAEFQEAVKNDDVSIQTNNQELLDKVESIKTPQAPSEVAPAVAEVTPTPVDIMGQMTEDEKASFANDVVDAVAGFRSIRNPDQATKQMMDTVREDVRQNPMVALDKAIDNAKKSLEKAKAESTGDVFSQANIEASQNVLDNLNQIKEKYATQISERQQQEIPQPSDIVQREGTQEGQPQVGQAEGGIGQATQQAADTGNRPISSQEQESLKNVESADKEIKPNWNYEGEGDAFASAKEWRDGKFSYVVRILDRFGTGTGYNRARLTGELDTDSPLTYEGDKELVVAIDGNGNTVGVIKLQSDGGVEHIVVAPEFTRKGVAAELFKQIQSKGAKVNVEKSKLISPDAAKLFNKLKSESILPKEQAPAMEEAPVEDIMTLDTKDETNLQKVFNWLDNIDKQLDKFGRETAGVNILLPVAKLIVKALKEAVGVTNNLQEAIKKVAADFKVTEKDVMDSLKSAETSSRVYSNEQVQGVITIANEAAANIKKTEKSSLKAYQQVFSTVQKAVQNLYDTGIVPDFASARVMAEVTQSIARDAVNAAYTSTKKISAQEVESVTMSTRKYIAGLMARQAKGAAQAFDKAKAVRKAVTDVFKAKNKQYGNKIQLSISDFNSLLKQMEDSVFRAPLTEEAINDAAAKATSIIEDAYNKKMNADMAAFEKQARPKIKELVDRFIQSEARKFDSVDAAAYSAFSKAMAYMDANKKEFGIKDREGDNVLSQEMDRAINELKQQKRDVAAADNVNQIFATPQGREIAAFAEAKAQEIAKSNKGKKIGKTTATQAYKNIVTELVKMINGMYARGNYPAGIPSITMVKAAYGVAQDAVNAVFPRSEKISPQEAQMVNMSMREYMRNLATSQINAIGKVKDRAKAIRTAVGKIIESLKDSFGADFKMSSAAFKQLNKNLFDAVFSKMDDATAIDDIINRVTPIIEYAMRRNLLSDTAKLLDKIRSNYKLGRYSGAARLSIMENLLNADARKWLNSNATLEDISIFNQYLKELTGKVVDTKNLESAVSISNQFVPTPQQSATTEKDSLGSKIKNLIKKVASGQIDFGDYATLVNLEKAINDIKERKGALSGLTQAEQDEIIQNYNDLVSSLPKPIDQLLDDAQAEIDADVKGKVQSLGTAINTSQEFRDSIKNPLLYEAVLRFANEMTDDFINSLTPKEKMQLSANIDEILRGNPNSTTYEFSAKAGAFKQSNINYKFGKDILSKRQVINNSGVTGFFGKIRRLFMDIDYNRASAERMAASFDLFKFHMMDVELNTGVDEFGMGVLEREIFNPIARAIDSAFNKVTEALAPMQEAMKLLNDKSNKAAIKKGIGLLNKELGTGFFGGKAKWMHIKKLLGYGNTFYMEVSTRMATIIATQIDHISNLQEGESPMDVVLLRNILEQKPDDYDGRTMKEHYQTNPTAITDKTDDASLFDHIAYGILTKGGVNKLSDLSKDELLALLTESQRQAIAKWREHIDNTRNVVEAAMIMRGSVTPFLNDYFPRRVFSKEGVTEIKDIEEYLAQAGGNVGVDSGQLKSRRGEVGRLDLNGNSVLYNNLKDIHLIHEVKPVLDSLKGLDNATERLKKERDLGAATYSEAVSIAVANRVKNALESNERISNNNYSFWYKSASKVTSFASRVILISQLRQAFADFPSNIFKLSASLGFANKSMKNQVYKVVTPEMSSYTTDKGKFKWDDYVKIALSTGSSVHRIMSVYADNFLYEFSKPKEQLQREQRVASWQDMAVKKRAWMSRFEEAFNRITGEYLDHEAFSDERGAYRAIYFDAVQKASDAADSFVDRQYSLASIARQPIRVNIAAPFVGRAIRNVFGKSPTIAKNNPASVILGFLTGYPTVQFQLFSRYMRSALSLDKDISAKQRTEDVARALTEVIVPSVMYNVIRASTGLIFTTTAAAVLAAGDDEEERKRLYKEMETMPFWKRWFAKTRIAIGEKQESFTNAVINGMLSSAIDPNVNAIVRPAAGFFLFKAWKENAIEDMTKSGKTKEEIQQAKQKIKEYENSFFETYSIRPIELFGTKEYQEGIKRYYNAGAQSEGVEDLIKSTGGFGILYNEVSRSMDLAKLIDATDENKNLSETELYVASALKLGGMTFANVILGGKAGAAISMFSGDMNKVANMIISDQKSIQTGFEIKGKKKKKSGGGFGKGGFGKGGFGKGGGFGSGGFK